ncbi:hypothetical protein CLIB1423_15S02168 [[Candida] railenensis]|uniref:Transcription initiation factor TFIID subunit 8 n=1 Tax=[Candida] railenensis TaxID=45579 RepID=A0A9P0QTG4_9ASCO|nr:hypothetical protein CLIB1423_15S02168 [[Candida] railenensis]
MGDSTKLGSEPREDDLGTEKDKSSEDSSTVARDVEVKDSDGATPKRTLVETTVGEDKDTVSSGESAADDTEESNESKTPALGGGNVEKKQESEPLSVSSEPKQVESEENGTKVDEPKQDEPKVHEPNSTETVRSEETQEVKQNTVDSDPNVAQSEGNEPTSVIDSRKEESAIVQPAENKPQEKGLEISAEAGPGPKIESAPDVDAGEALTAHVPTTTAQIPDSKPVASNPIEPEYIPIANPYIPPQDRRLSPETVSLLNKPHLSINTTSPVDLFLFKVIAMILKSKDFEFSEEFIWRLKDLTSIYFFDLSKQLHQFTEMQRKSKPSKSDIDLLLKMRRIKPSHLFEEYEKSRGFTYMKDIKTLDKLTNDSINPEKEVEYTNDDPSLLFFTNEHYEITELVPKKSGKPKYVPHFLPDLPPDYTYQKTPIFMDRLTDLKELRLKMVEESRLTEKSLYKLIDDDEIKWKDKFEKELDDLDEERSDGEDSVMSDRPEKHTDVESVDLNEEKGNAAEKEDDSSKPILSAESQKKFDIVAYAQKRLKLREEKEKKVFATEKLRESNIYLQAETYFSPYATHSKTPEISAIYENIVDESFKKVILSVRTAEKNKKRKIEFLIKEREAKEKEREKARENVEFGFSFGEGRRDDRLEDSDEDDDDKSDGGFGTGDFPEFDFPVSQPPQTEPVATSDQSQAEATEEQAATKAVQPTELPNETDASKTKATEVDIKTESIEPSSVITGGEPSEVANTSSGVEISEATASHPNTSSSDNSQQQEAEKGYTAESTVKKETTEEFKEQENPAVLPVAAHSADLASSDDDEDMFDEITNALEDEGEVKDDAAAPAPALALAPSTTPPAAAPAPVSSSDEDDFEDI